MLSDEEIIRRLKLVRHSSRVERNARRILSMNRIAEQTGLSRKHLYALCNGTDPITPNVRRRLSDIMTCYEEEGVRGKVPPSTVITGNLDLISVLFGPSRLN